MEVDEGIGIESSSATESGSVYEPSLDTDADSESELSDESAVSATTLL